MFYLMEVVQSINNMDKKEYLKIGGAFVLGGLLALVAWNYRMIGNYFMSLAKYPALLWDYSNEIWIDPNIEGIETHVIQIAEGLYDGYELVDGNVVVTVSQGDENSGVLELPSDTIPYLRHCTDSCVDTMAEEVTYDDIVLGDEIRVTTESMYDPVTGEQEVFFRDVLISRYSFEK